MVCPPAGSSAYMVKTGGPRGSRRRCEFAIFDKSNMPASCPLTAVPRDVSRCFSYACHRCKGGLNLHSDQGNLHLCVRVLLQSAAGRLCTRNKMRHHRDARPSRLYKQRLNTRVIQSVELAFTILRRFRFLHLSSIVSLFAHSL